MPMDFLRRIENVSFPLVITDEKDIRNAIVLEAAELIKAQLPDPDKLPGSRPAVIFGITPEGRNVLSSGAPPP